MASEGGFMEEFVLPLFTAGDIGICLDIGAYDPEWINNSWSLEKLGWKVFCVEPNPHCIPTLRTNRKNVIELAIGSENKDNVDFYIYHVDPHIAGPLGMAAGSGLIVHPEMGRFETTLEKVSVRTFEWLMENEIKEDHVDIICIDVEGSEMDILSTLDVSKWLPKVIVCENILETKDQHDWFERNGFCLLKRFGFNDIYIRMSEIHLKVGK